MASIKPGALQTKVGGSHLSSFILRQLPLLPRFVYDEPCLWDVSVSFGDWIRMRVLELVYTSWDLSEFAKDCGYTGEPFSWDPERRLLLRCELDAAFFRLYGIARDDVDYIMDAFPIVRRRDEGALGEFVTKSQILASYDELAGRCVTESAEPSLSARVQGT